MRRIPIIALLLAGCVQLPPTPEDIQAKKFEIPPGMSVIYIVRTPLDSREAAGLWLDDKVQITTMSNTYYRWETAPGLHRITGAGRWSDFLELRTEAGKIYFVQQTAYGTIRAGAQITWVQLIDEQAGRKLVLQSELL